MDAQDAQFEEMAKPEAAAPGDHLELRDLNRVRVRVDAVLGDASMSVRHILELKEGSVIPLTKTAGEMTNITVNDLPLAKGEVVVIGDDLHVRIAEITGSEDYIEH